MTIKNAFYAQSGGVTSVINASACGVIQTAKQYPKHIGTVYAGLNGILGGLREELVDTYKQSDMIIAALKHTPAGAFGSCRYKLKSIDGNHDEYERLIEVFKAHNIGYFFYNGGGDSADTCLKIAQFSQRLGYPLQTIHIPKTIDNDLAVTDNSPGFGSAAKYVAISTKEAALDIQSICDTSTKVFILEVMGRHAGWLAGASGLAAENEDDAPHIILFPEITFNPVAFLERIKATVKEQGYCVIVASEGIAYEDGNFLADGNSSDAFGHKQLGGVALALAHIVSKNLPYKYRFAIVDYLQRSARHIASATDVEQAYAVGKAAVKYGIEGKNAIMPAIIRDTSDHYTWHVEPVDLTNIANIEKLMPRHYISSDGFQLSPAGRKYLMPLIQGEDYPPYNHNGLPQYARIDRTLVEPKTHKTFFI